MWKPIHLHRHHPWADSDGWWTAKWVAFSAVIWIAWATINVICLNSLLP